MKIDRKSRRRSQEGIALLIAIFVLLLISVVAIALLVSSGTETALGANYRSSSTVYYAALAGLEEARGRLLPKNPNYFGLTVPELALGTALPLGQTVYVLNRLQGEVVAPWDPANVYYDKEYKAEFGQEASTASWQGVSSVWDNNVQGIPGPVYKWVRINAATEQSLFMDVDQDGTIDPTPALYYDPAHVDSHGNSMPSLIVPAGSPPSTAAQALEITALAALPNGSQKYLQYLVTPNSVMLPPFPAAVTLVGNNVDYTGPGGAPAWFVSGNDTISLGSCAPGLPAYAVGYSNNRFSDPSYTNIHTGSFTGQPLNYPGLGGSAGPPATPSLGFIGGLIPPNLQTEVGLNSIVQDVVQNHLYDILINGNATGANLPSGMSPSNPMTIVVNGDLDISNSFHSQGYGLLIVTGNFKYDPDSSWYGIILVIGQGTVNAIVGRSGDNGQIVGAMFVAKTVGSPVIGMPGTSLPDSGDNTAEFPDSAQTFMNGRGVYYSSCWIKAATPTGSFHIISFHEIPH
jgi:hypothetical protein